MNSCFGADATATFRAHVRICSPGFVLMLMASIISTLANLL
ncbi:hypothetical protein Hanom_Chr07g00615261 [Helianthus anomalus]